jgi:hypothetical protein
MIVMRGYLGGDADYLCRRSSVIVVAPALGATPVWQKVGARGPERFSDTASGEAFRAARERILAEAPKGLPPQAVAETVWTALGIGEHSCGHRSLCRRSTLPPSGPRCTYLW